MTRLCDTHVACVVQSRPPFCDILNVCRKRNVVRRSINYYPLGR